MTSQIPVITEFVSAFRTHNHTNFRMESKGRYSAAFICPLHGRIRFSQGKHCVIADNLQPVYIPAGAVYINECLEAADSIVFNFNDTNGYERITPLSPADAVKLTTIYGRICAIEAFPSERNQAEIFSLLYQVMGECFAEEKIPGQELLAPALELIEARLHDPELNLDELAKSCSISKVYLNKLFVRVVGMPPFRYITRARMERARYMLMEMCPVGEVARNVGYSDIYQFSRAYKKYYGVSPKG